MSVVNQGHLEWLVLFMRDTKWLCLTCRHMSLAPWQREGSPDCPHCGIPCWDSEMIQAGLDDGSLQPMARTGLMFDEEIMYD